MRFSTLLLPVVPAGASTRPSFLCPAPHRIPVARRSGTYLLLGVVMGLSPAATTAQQARQYTSETAARSSFASAYAKLPLSFEANQGQSEAAVRFSARGSGFALFLTGGEAVLALTKRQPIPAEKTNQTARTRKRARATAGAGATDVVQMQLRGAARHPQVTGIEEQAGTANYFVGNDPDRWRTNVPTFGRVKYTAVYPGVDLVYYGNQRQLEYDIVVAPRADPRPVRLHFDGAERLSLNAGGDLRVQAAHGEIAFHKPSVYQRKGTDRAAGREPVQGRFLLLADNSVGFALGKYDRDRELVIDPVLTYSTYLGGTVDDQATAVATDSSGHAYVTGYTYSLDFPVTQGEEQAAKRGVSGYSNAFVTKLNAAGTALIYSTYLGGSDGDAGNGIAVDVSGNAYVTGYTDSPDFPVTHGAFQTADTGTANQSSNAFVAKLNAAGSALVYSTYLGGSGGGGETGDEAYAVAVDSSGSAYVAGYTFSTNFPTTSGALQTVNNDAAKPLYSGFVTKLNPAGSAASYSTYLGGSGGEMATSIAVDSAGNAYVGGFSNSKDFPVTAGAFQTINRDPANGNGFVAKLNAAGSRLIYATYLGGSGAAFDGETVGCIAADSAGNAYVTGETPSVDFPVTGGAFQTAYVAGTDNFFAAENVFISKLNPTGTALSYSTYIGGDEGASAEAIAIDAGGSAYVTGFTYSTDFPVTYGAYQPTNLAAVNASRNEFVIKLNPTGSSLDYATYLGGSGTEYDEGDTANGIAVDGSGNVYVTGYTAARDFPVTSGAFQTTNRTTIDPYFDFAAFVSKLSLGSLPTLTATTTTVTSNANPAASGAGFTVIAAVKPASGTRVPSGSVVFRVDGRTAATVALNAAGNAQYSSPALSAGAHLIASTYSGDANFYNGSGSMVETVVGPAATIAAVSGANQTTAYGSAFANPLIALVKDADGNPVNGASIKFSGAGLNFSPALATTNASGEAVATATPITTGVVTATASVTGVAKSATYTLDGTKPYLTLTAVNLSVPFGQAIPAVSHTTTGFVNGDTASVLTGAAVESTSAEKGSPIGTYPIYLSHGTLAAANYIFRSVNGTVQVTHAVTATPTFTPTAGTYITKQSVSLQDATAGSVIYYTANGTTPTTASTKYSGPITVGASETILAMATSSAYPASAVASGTYSILIATTTSLTSSLTPSHTGTPVTFTAKVTAASGPVPTGTITFFHGGTALGTAALSGGVATFATSTLPTGSLSITASYAAGIVHAGSVSAAVSQVVQ